MKATGEGSSDGMTRAERLIRAAFVTAGFALIGPFVGAMLIYVPVFGKAALFAVGQMTSVHSQPDWTSLDGLFTGALFFAMFGYLIGGLSAILAGVALGFRMYRNGEIGYGETAIVSALAALIGSVIVFAVPNRDVAAAGGLLVFLVPLGVVSGLVCRFLLARLRVLPGHANHATSPAERN